MKLTSTTPVTNVTMTSAAIIFFDAWVISCSILTYLMTYSRLVDGNSFSALCCLDYVFAG